MHWSYVFLALTHWYQDDFWRDILYSNPQDHKNFVNSLAPGRFKFNFWSVIFKLTLMNGGWDISYEIALRWMQLDLSDDKSTLVQVMDWCRQATSHYLSQCWPRSMSSNGVTRPQWVNFKQKFAILCNAANSLCHWIWIINDWFFFNKTVFITLQYCILFWHPSELTYFLSFSAAIFREGPFEIIAKLDQLECLCSENTPFCPMISHILDSYWIPFFQIKTRQSLNYKFEKSLEI